MGEGNIFSLCVSSHSMGGGGTPSTDGAFPGPGGGTPFPGPGGGLGVPLPRSRWGGGEVKGYPHPDQIPGQGAGGRAGYSPSRSDPRMGGGQGRGRGQRYPPSRSDPRMGGRVEYPPSRSDPRMGGGEGTPTGTA